MLISVFRRLLYLLLLIFLAGCASVDSGSSSASTADSHNKDTEPDYATVFPQDAVNRIDITLSAEAWEALQSELSGQFGQPGQGDKRSGFPGGQPPADRQNPGAGQLPGMGGPGMDMGQTSYVASTVQFNGETWQSVGFRYSGNSTLRDSWSSGTQKISFRLDFDQFEQENPATKDQRFYGFQQISFKSNAMDDSYLREKVTSDIFRAAGVVASQTAFYAVYIDTGEGPQYFGLYTAVEIVDDTVIETQFADDSGNVYKPEGSGAAFAAGTFDVASFEKQTNQEEADWSDIQAVFSALHAGTRTSDPAAWRAGLEAVFDVDAFLRWLAVDTIVQNWDTYGAMSHNYYLYTDPSDGLVTWIPWDNNMALSASGGRAGAPAGGNPPAGNLPGGDRPGGDRPGGDRPGGWPGGPGGSVRELDLESVGAQWPLIRYLIDDPVYAARYRQYLSETIQTAFQPEALAEKYQYYHDLIRPYAAEEQPGYTQLNSLDSFDQALEALIEHARQRYQAVQAYLASQ